MPRGRRDWFRRVSEKKARDWELYDLNQCLTLSLFGMERNDPLLISASYLWSNTLNAFIFGHGPMTITLADVYMLIGLRITGSMQPYDFLSAGSKKLAKISDCIGWASYILNHIGDESSCGPTYNHKLMVEHLAVGKDIPLGKYLLGAAYHLMHQVAV